MHCVSCQVTVHAQVTRLCFEPATASAMGRGIFIPYGVGHGAEGLRCPAGSGERGPPPPDAPRASTLMFAGSLATNAARGAWVSAMRRVGEPACRLQPYVSVSEAATLRIRIRGCNSNKCRSSPTWHTCTHARIA